MPTKIKMFIGFLAVIAVVSVLSFSDVFKLAQSDILDVPRPELKNPEADVDHDGLLNIDESYWNTDFENPDTDGDGFLDGEEVASRHDPTKPGPNDKLADYNLSEKLANLAIAGLAEGSLNPNSPNFESSIDTLAYSVIDDGTAISFESEYNTSNIKIVDSDKKSQENYLKAISSTLQLFLKVLAHEVSNFESKLELINDGGMANPEYISFFTKKRDEFDLVSKQWLLASVPKNWASQHYAMLNLMVGLVEINDSLSKGKDDPVKAAVGFNLFINLIESFPDVLASFTEKIQKENITDISI